MLANVIDTDQVNREHQTNSCHQFSISKLVKQNSRNQTGEKVDNPTRNLSRYPSLLFYADVWSPDTPSKGNDLVVVTLGEAECLPVGQDPGPHSEVEEPGQPQQVEVSIPTGVREEVVPRSHQSRLEGEFLRRSFL